MISSFLFLKKRVADGAALEGNLITSSPKPLKRVSSRAVDSTSRWTSLAATFADSPISLTREESGSGALF